MKAYDAGAALRAISSLRALCLSLPHLPTPAESHRMRRFATLRATPELAGLEDTETVLTGWRQLWCDGRTDDLLAMARRLPPALVEGDRRLASYALAAREVSPRSRKPDA
jgi:hypothetical protein